jgi:hypothetical protein
MFSLLSQKELKGQRRTIHPNKVNLIKQDIPKPSLWDSVNINRTLHFPACMHKTKNIKTLCIQLGITQSNFYILAFQTFLEVKEWLDNLKRMSHAVSNLYATFLA